MKIVNIVVISIVLFLSVGFSSAVSFTEMADIVTDNPTPTITFKIHGNPHVYTCDLFINNIPSGMVIVDINTLSHITCNRTLDTGVYEYYISTYEMGYHNSSCYSLQIISTWYDAPVEAIGYISDGFQHIGDSTESLLLWGIIFCAIVILLGMIGMFMKALRG